MSNYYPGVEIINCSPPEYDLLDISSVQKINKLILAKDKYKKIKDKDTEIAKLADELELAEENLKEIGLIV